MIRLLKIVFFILLATSVTLEIRIPSWYWLLLSVLFLIVYLITAFLILMARKAALAEQKVYLLSLESSPITLTHLRDFRGRHPEMCGRKVPITRRLGLILQFLFF